MVVWGVAALVTCTILPSGVAFTSLISAAGVPSSAAYGLICFGRFFLTPKDYPKPRWSLGRWSRPFQFIGIFWNGWCVAILFSPYEFPVTGATLNCTFLIVLPRKRKPVAILMEMPSDAPIIMAIVTVFALISWWVTPEDAWLPSERIANFVESKGEGDVTDTTEETGTENLQ